MSSGKNISKEEGTTEGVKKKEDSKKVYQTERDRDVYSMQKMFHCYKEVLQ